MYLNILLKKLLLQKIASTHLIIQLTRDKMSLYTKKHIGLFLSCFDNYVLVMSKKDVKNICSLFTNAFYSQNVSGHKNKSRPKLVCSWVIDIKKKVCVCQRDWKVPELESVRMHFSSNPRCVRLMMRSRQRNIHHACQIHNRSYLSCYY